MTNQQRKEAFEQFKASPETKEQEAKFKALNQNQQQLAVLLTYIIEQVASEVGLKAAEIVEVLRLTADTVEQARQAVQRIKDQDQVAVTE